MSFKSSLGKTDKYQNVVKNVQSAKPQEEPRISQQEVVQAFRSFGFEPNQRNHDDIAYWTIKGKSEKSKLIEELSKRRKELNQGEDDSKKEEEKRRKIEEEISNKQRESKATLPRLSDKEIADLFDEYGLPTPDPEWARNHMPNDPKKIRSLLEMQRKMADDMLKKHTKNAVNSIPETPKMTSSPMGQSTTTPMMGQGGPVNMQGTMTQDTTPITPFFIGDHAIVRIANQNNPNVLTTWLVDANKKILRPFSSEHAFRNAFDNPDEAEKSVMNISSKDLGPGGALEGFTPLKGDKGVNDDGTMERIEFSQAQLQDRYGKAESPEAENKSLSILDGIFGNLNKPQQ